MKQSKKMLAALVAIPASVIVAGEVQAAEPELMTDDEIVVKLNTDIPNLSEATLKETLLTMREQYKLLSPDKQALVIDYNKVEELIEEKEKAAAKAVEELIRNLYDDSPFEKIEAARKAYNELTDVEKAYVPSNIVTYLEKIEAHVVKLKEQAKTEAQVIIDRITRITGSYTETEIRSIRLAYQALSVLAQSYVTNYQSLVNAENNIIYQNTVVKEAKLAAAGFDEYMSKITRYSTTQEIAKARAYYNSLSAETRKHVSTYEKLVRLETMWKDPDYIGLVYTYYPEYVHAVKPGAITVTKPTYDPLYIPDESTWTSSNGSFANVIPDAATWSPYNEMMYQNGSYVTKLTSSQVANYTDPNVVLKANNVNIVLPMTDLKTASGTVGVALTLSNNQINIQFSAGNSAMQFSKYVEIHIPMSIIKGNASQIIQRVSGDGSSVASYKVDGSNFIIRTKSSGTFKTATAKVNYRDIGTGTQGQSILELAKHGIAYNTTARQVNVNNYVSRADIATMITSALDLSSSSKSSFADLGNALSASRAQGLLEAGIMSGLTSSSYSPTATVTKQEAAIILSNMYRYLNQDLSLAYNELKSNYRDISNLTYEARQSIAILELFGVVNGTGTFNPNENLTRGQFAELFHKALKAIDYL
jgi:N-acetylmuramoyl-L-alanine amidase